MVQVSLDCNPLVFPNVYLLQAYLITYTMTINNIFLITWLFTTGSMLLIILVFCVAFLSLLSSILCLVSNYIVIDI